MNLELINDRLNQLIPDDHSTLSQAARYALISGGKRVRPLLLLDVARHYQVDELDALTPACALEMIHAYSLIHDDLPCMDDDDFRRGMPTVHKKYSEAVAVLTGDFLLTKAFEIVSAYDHLTATQRIDLICILSQCAGGDGMIGGQLLDLEAENREISVEELRSIHSKKTGCLFAAAAMMAGVIAHVDAAELEKLQRYGMHLGLAFQIMDDVRDVTDARAKHGGKISSDVRNQKSTYVSLLGIAQAKVLAQEELSRAETLFFFKS